ncbi:MAG: WD40/YVTN/BNR-like repeat-containing protein [Candidatus Aminicenantaceae bacterium]
MSLHFRKVFQAALMLCLVLGVSHPFYSQTEGSNGHLIKDLKWRSVGPANMIGRISDFEALENDFTQVLVAGASGGVWKSVNAGTTWEPIFDKYGSASIGDVAFYQKDPNIIWVGTGEECPRNSIAWGDGIYKSTDGGKTFAHMGLKNTHSIARVLPHLDSPDIVYAAAAGHTWGYSGDRGLFKTTDGGKTWQKLTNGLPDDGKTGAIDLIMHPKNADILYVGFWQRVRQPWRFDSGGPNSGIYKSTDAGASWTKLTQGLPEGDLGRVGLAISRSNPDVLMAMVEHSYQPQRQIREGTTQKPNPEYDDMTKLGTGMYRSEDAGATWMYMNRTNTRPFYYSHIYINPLDDKLVYYLATSMQYSEDGGKTLKTIQGLHPDFHTMWLDPTHKDRFYVGQDGGASITYDGGKTWILFDNLCMSQFYAVSADNRDPYYVYGGLQDNGSWAGPSMNREGMILTDHWFNFGGGDGFYTQNDPTDWRIVYGESQGGNIFRMNIETRENARIRPSQQTTYNWADHAPPPPKKKAEAAQQPSRFGRQRSPFRQNWSSPILISPHNSSTIYFGGDRVFKSINRGDNWTIISPDLTTNDPEKHSKPTGGITLDQTGAETHCSITTLSESPRTPGLLWAGTDDGNVQVTRDGGIHWTNVRENVPDVPPEIWVSRVEASRFDEGTCYLTFDGHRSDVFAPFVFKTTDYGKTWTNIGADLPKDGPVYVIREDLKNKGLLFVGTEFAVFFSSDGGKIWGKLNLNMPTVAVHDLVIHPRDNDLIAGTHGRGIWILDDISPLQQATDKVLEAEAHLFESTRPGTQWLNLGRGGYGRGNLFFAGENPPEGAVINFYLKEKPAGPVAVEIMDATGKLKTLYTLKEAGAGINRLLWDMRFDPSPQAMKASLASMQSMMERILDRPEVEPEAKATVEKAFEQLKQPGLTYREAADIQRKAFETIGFGGGRFRGRGRGGGAAVAEPGAYAVKLTVNGKTYDSTITVRKDPKLTGGNN